MEVWNSGINSTEWQTARYVWSRDVRRKERRRRKIKTETRRSSGIATKNSKASAPGSLCHFASLLTSITATAQLFRSTFTFGSFGTVPLAPSMVLRQLNNLSAPLSQGIVEPRNDRTFFWTSSFICFDSSDSTSRRGCVWRQPGSKSEQKYRFGTRLLANKEQNTTVRIWHLCTAALNLA